jgi:hypothetical protein
MVLIAARENAIPGEAVFHEKLERPRLGRLVARDEPNRDRDQTRDAGRRDPASTSFVNRH